MVEGVVVLSIAHDQKEDMFEELKLPVTAHRAVDAAVVSRRREGMHMDRTLAHLSMLLRSKGETVDEVVESV